MNEKHNMKFPNNQYANIILGPGDKNIDLLEQLTGTKVFIKEENLVFKFTPESIEEEHLERYMKALFEIAKYNEDL